MSDSKPAAKKRIDYRAPDFTISTVTLNIFLDPDASRVESSLQVQRLSDDKTAALVLDGESLELKSLKLDGKPWSAYEKRDNSLVLSSIPDNFTLDIEVEIAPAQNTSLEGLYLASEAYCTQCEAEGFRRITYFLDRPDVLAEYRVTVHADKADYPHLLSNGNKVGQGENGDGTHWVTWHDPFKKPCYLFALVAGNFDVLTDHFVTQSGRHINLELYVDKGKRNRGQHALDSLKKAMRWDEQVFGLEYDLDIYMIVAVDFFNMGAMENKGLNVFNSKYVLADPETATDEDYYNIESVIAHEYFHNWTGNRVTCRDWFQLSLKEGLTVFRDQQFSADMASDVVTRIKNVRVMREHQFAEDASAMAHPIRPDEVIEMNNFYTVTVYDKGAEVIRMMHTLLGADGFRKGMDLYFKRHDGKAVTCDDFVDAMQDANNKDLSQFRRWYSQSGTPRVVVKETYDDAQQRYTLQFEQINAATADQQHKLPLVIPIKFELLSAGSADDISDAPALIELTEPQQTVTLAAQTKPTPVMLGDFSAPVRLEFAYSAEQLLDIATGSANAFSRWDAAQTLYSHYIHGQADNVLHDQISVSDVHIDDLVNGIFAVADNDPALAAEMLSLPSHETLVEQVSQYQVEALLKARQSTRERLAAAFSDKLSQFATVTAGEEYQYIAEQINARRLRQVCLGLYAHCDAGNRVVSEAYHRANNMTDSLAALKAAQGAMLSGFEGLMEHFEQRWRSDPLVLDKWFALHAGAHRSDILSRLDLLRGHQQFTMKNPNRVRALIGTFAFYNPAGFHAADGSGYRYLTDYLLALDELNPQVASRLVTPLTQWKKLDDDRQQQIKLQLLRLADKPGLSKDVFEKVSKSLNQ